MTGDDQIQEVRMQRAIELAKRAWGQTHPNPMVGALIVEDDEIVAEGWHRAAGQPHAEIEALRALGRRPKPEAEIYVTLEPCSTCGRTGACTDAIIESGIRRVIVGATDPNPQHAGAGFLRLRDAGVEVIEGICAAECSDLNLIFNHWITKGQTFVAMKMAMTLDGKFAAASGQSQWVTGELARADVMQWRRYFPAIAVGAGTVLADDPQLTSRIGDDVWCPQRYVLDRELVTADKSFRLYSDEYAGQTTVVCSELADPERVARMEGLGIRLEQVPEVDGHLDLIEWRRRVSAAGICGLYVETGPQLSGAFLESGFADYAFVYQAPKFMSDAAAPGIGRFRQTQHMSEAIALRDVEQKRLGDDRLVRGWL